MLQQRTHGHSLGALSLSLDISLATHIRLGWRSSCADCPRISHSTCVSPPSLVLPSSPKTLSLERVRRETRESLGDREAVWLSSKRRRVESLARADRADIPASPRVHVQPGVRLSLRQPGRVSTSLFPFVRTASWQRPALMAKRSRLKPIIRPDYEMRPQRDYIVRSAGK